MAVIKTFDELACPFCQSSNSCTPDKTTSCWCSNVQVPQGLRDLLPLELQNTVCICNDCITRFNADESVFISKLAH